MSNKVKSFGPAVIPAILLGICVLLAHPSLEMGLNDDWSYLWSARVLADTGKIAYNGWGAMMLGWQLYIGAFFIKYFGFSFHAGRASVFLLAIVTAGFLQRVIARCGIREWNASFAALTITLCPLFLPLAFSFMSDVPSFLCLIVCLYGCLRAIQAAEDRVALGWLAFAAISNALGGTVRQVAWLGVLVFVPCATWIMRRRRGALLIGLLLWIVSGVFIVACLHWFKLQPYTFAEGLNTHSPIPRRHDLHTLLTGFLCALPVLTAFVRTSSFKRESPRSNALMGASFAVWLAAVFFFVRKYAAWRAPFSLDLLTSRGIDIQDTLIGHRPEILSPGVQYGLTLFAAAALFAFVLCILKGSRLELSVQDRVSKVSESDLWILLAPFSAVYLLLIATRQSIFDRYCIPLLFVVVVALLRFYERKVSNRLTVTSFVVLGAMAAFSVASTHDLYATYRARLAAADELRAAGIPRGEISAGVEYDGWTELELAGYISNPRLQVGGPREPMPDPSKACEVWYQGWMPMLHPRYRLSYEPLPCLNPSQYGPLVYKTWISPQERKIYILAMPK